MFFLKVLIAHLIGDFVLQPESWVKNKQDKKIKSPKLYLHIGVHILLLLFALQFNTKYIGGFFLIITTHFLFDLGKIYIQNKKNKRWLFFIDQTLHIIILILAAGIYNGFSVDFSSYINEKNLLFVVGVISVTFVASVVINTLLSYWNIKNILEEKEALKNAGKYIGMLERLFVFVFVILGRWEAVGFLLAAKSIFRFGDLTASKDRKLTEYVLIGTLLSFAIAIFTGMLYLHFAN